MGNSFRHHVFESVRAGAIAGLAMVPFAAVFRAQGMRINEYGRKVLELLVGEVGQPLRDILSFVQHMAISCIVALPLLVLLCLVDGRGRRLLVGGLYGAAFYVAVNSLALPLLFHDSTPWELGWPVVYPSLVVHLVYGVAVAMVARVDALRAC